MPNTVSAWCMGRPCGLSNRGFPVLEMPRLKGGDRMFRDHPLPVRPAPVVRFRHDIQVPIE